MGVLEWREEPNRIFVAETAFFRLRVDRPGDSAHIRFLVREPRPTGPDALIASGTRDGFAEAMAAAEQMVNLLDGVAARTRALVIVVDDNAPVRDAVAETLREGGFDVAESNSGERALRMIADILRPIVLVSDINLGAGLSGLELAAIVHERWPRTGILLVTGDDTRAQDAPCQDFLIKPFSSSALLKRVLAVEASLQASDRPRVVN